MKITVLCCMLYSTATSIVVGAFQIQNNAGRLSNHVVGMTEKNQEPTQTIQISNRQDFIKTVSMAGATLMVSNTLFMPDAAYARGRATLEKTYERYSPRIREGSKFYGTELRSMVAKDDWTGIKLALAEPPARKDGDLRKPDAGVAERARLAGGFSDARVLVAADLFAAAFSESSIREKTKKMQSFVNQEREIINEMQRIAKQALGEEVSGGFFGLGAKKADPAELSKKMKELYVSGGNTWNEYLLAANDNLALQFDRFEYVK